jgi:hypothetical protein
MNLLGHVTGVVPDGEDYRLCCVCGWISLSQLTEAAARNLSCEVEAKEIEGRARLAAYMARQQVA